MKLTSKSSKIWLIILLSIAIAACCLLITLIKYQPAAKTPDPQAAQQVTPNTDDKNENQQPIRITLPNTDPFPALVDNYADDASLWRIVNKTNFLTNLQYRPSNLQVVSVQARADKSADERSLRADVIPHIEQLFQAAQESGVQLMVGSGFRSYELQNIYYTNYVKTYSQAAADRVSAKPGSSEHQTGLAVDLSAPDRTCYLEECFADTAAGKWLAQNAHTYGFILRYPKSKESITGFNYEPWHFRYVGADLARAIYESNLTLEEAAPHLEKARQELLRQQLITE